MKRIAISFFGGVEFTFLGLFVKELNCYELYHEVSISDRPVGLLGAGFAQQLILGDKAIDSSFAKVVSISKAATF